MLIIRIFSFSHNVFYPSLSKFQFLIYFLQLSANDFNLNGSELCQFAKMLNQFSVHTSLIKIIIYPMIEKKNYKKSFLMKIPSCSSDSLTEYKYLE